MTRVKPRRWIEHLPTKCAEPAHAYQLRKHGLAGYLAGDFLLLRDDELQAAMHPGIRYGRIYPPKLGPNEYELIAVVS